MVQGQKSMKPGLKCRYFQFMDRLRLATFSATCPSLGLNRTRRLAHFGVCPYAHTRWLKGLLLL